MGTNVQGRVASHAKALAPGPCCQTQVGTCTLEENTYTQTKSRDMVQDRRGGGHKRDKLKEMHMPHTRQFKDPESNNLLRDLQGHVHESVPSSWTCASFLGMNFFCISVFNDAGKALAHGSCIMTVSKSNLTGVD